MEWITAVWNKLNKPLHFLLVGVALALFAPEQHKWIGYIFAAFGVAGTIEWAAKHVHNWWEARKKQQDLERAISNLNIEERTAVFLQLQTDAQTFYFDPFSSRSIPDHSRKLGLYR